MAWHIHTIDRMFAGPDTQASIIIGGREVWVRAVPDPYYTFPVERIKAAWAVLTGKAHAVKWPREGDLERVWHGGGRAPRPRRYAVKEKTVSMQTIETALNHGYLNADGSRRDNHCCGCWRIESANWHALKAVCNECGETLDLAELLDDAR